MLLQTSPSIESASGLQDLFLPYQLEWILAEQKLAAKRQPAMALAEKSVRIGWTYADAFKNVRKRILNRKRDYLFATRDYPSAVEYVRQCYQFAEVFNLTQSIVRHGEESIQVNKLDEQGKPSALTEEVRIGVIKFENGSRIIAFSANPQAMAVYGGDVGLDEFAKHPNAKLLWETAQGRIAWGGDLAVWSAHDGEDTLFNEFAQEARAGKGPWNIYFRVTMPDAIDAGLVERINAAKGANFTREQYLADCRSRSREEEIFEQAYLCNPAGASTSHIVAWSAIERCRHDYTMERVHLEADQVLKEFGEVSTSRPDARQRQIENFLRAKFPQLFAAQVQPRLGFDVAASGDGDLAAFYLDEAKGTELWLRALLTVRTEDWDFLKTVLHCFLRHVPNLQGAGDESGLGRQICWEASKQFSSRFQSVNFSSKKHDLGFALMNQLSSGEKRFPTNEPDIAADYFALRKVFTGSKWIFTEGLNTCNPVSHCDIAWAGALSSYAHTTKKSNAWAMLG